MRNWNWTCALLLGGVAVATGCASHDANGERTQVTAGALDAVAASLPGAPPPSCTASPSSASAGSVRGIDLYYLDGVGQDLGFILEHQDEPAVAQRLNALFCSFLGAGVNWLRFHVSANYNGAGYPSVDPVLLDRVNRFLARTRAGTLAGKFTVEVMLIGKRDATTDFYVDAPPYANDKQWIATWMRGLDRTNVGRVMIAGDASPCGWDNGFVCAPNAPPLNNNHGAWLRDVWPWFEGAFPNVVGGYEVILNADPGLIEATTPWILANTPSVPDVAASMYFDLPAGTPWQAYADRMTTALSAFEGVAGGKRLWIDEYGSGVSATRSAADQSNAYAGILAALSACRSSVDYPRFAWVGGRDYPGNGTSFGLVDRFDGSTPRFQPAWESVSLYYGLDRCPGASATPPIAALPPAPSCQPPTISAAGTGCSDGNCVWMTGSNFASAVNVAIYAGDFQPFQVLREYAPSRDPANAGSMTIRIDDPNLQARLRSAAGLAVVVQNPACGNWSSPVVVRL